MISAQRNGSAAAGDLAESFKALLDTDKSYRGRVHELVAFMERSFPSLTVAGSPITHGLERWNADDLQYLITEYSGFSNESIHMFLDARIRSPWPELQREIDRNVGEELGDLCDGVPHLELMRYGYRRELGIETDDVPRSQATQDFIARMRRAFQSSDFVFTAGALLAFEATATAEFTVVANFLRQYKLLTGGEIAPETLTGKYIAGHVATDPTAPENPEDAHYAGMLDSMAQRIDEVNVTRFTAGFVAVCGLLDMWWNRLVQDIELARLERIYTPALAPKSRLI